MAFQGLHVETRVSGRKDDESNDSNITTTSLEVVVESSKGLNKHISAFVAKLVATSSEEQQGLVQVKVYVTMEMTMHKLHYFFFVDLVKVLKLMGDSLDIQTIRSDQVWPPLNEVFCLLRRDVAHGCEDVSQVS